MMAYKIRRVEGIVANLLIDKYYDIACSVCARHRSTDFYESIACADGGMGMETSIACLRKVAKKEGWLSTEEGNICPVCREKVIFNK